MTKNNCIIIVCLWLSVRTYTEQKQFIIYINNLSYVTSLKAPVNLSAVTTMIHMTDSLGLEPVNETYNPRPKIIDKRKFDENFKNRYESDAFHYEMKLKKKNILMRFFEWLFGPSFYTTSNNQGAFWVWVGRIITYIVITVVVYVIVRILLGKKGKWLFDKNDNKRTISFPDSEENIQNSDYMSLYLEAKKTQNFRLAIRYRYLILLQQLVQKGIIKYHKEKTNTDYGYEIRDKELSAAFSYVSYLYEHVWYGGFDLENPNFLKAEQAFDHTSSIIAP